MRMRFAAVLLLVSGCMSEIRPAAAFVARGVPGPVQQTESAPGLQLTTEVVGLDRYSPRYVGLRLRLTFKNVGVVPLILDKNCSVVRRLVSRDPKAAAAKQYESAATFDYMGAVPPREGPSNRADFVTLKPGEEHAFDTGVGSFTVHDGEGEPVKGELGRGEHYLQLEVNTWSYLNDPAPFRRRWRKQGFLWSETLTSQPMPFTL
jgi:hypothetical protein